MPGHRWSRLLASLSVSLLCTVSCVPELELYPELSHTRDCRRFPHLCDLEAEDLGGGDRPDTFRLVFVGDGFAGELWRYRDKVDCLLQELYDQPGSFVPWDPEAFHFYRVDVPARTTLVDNAELRDTPLATHLLDPDSCAGRPFIAADRELMALAAANAQRAFPELERIDAVILIARQSEGRANADHGGDVRMSELSGGKTLLHELGHALFWLGDEYSEFEGCPEQPVPTHHGPSPDVREDELLSCANLTRAEHPAKWDHLVDTVRPGGGRWPCLHHPTEACLMLSTYARGFCPVCEAAMREVMSARACGPDSAPPRVVVVEEERPGDFMAAAYDERGLESFAWWLDGEQLGAGALATLDGPFLSLDYHGLAPGAHELVACAVDLSGNQGCSPPAALEVSERWSPTIAAIWPPLFERGWVQVTVSTTLEHGWLVARLGTEEVRRALGAAQPTVWIPAGPEPAGLQQVTAEVVTPDGRWRSEPASAQVLIPTQIEVDDLVVGDPWQISAPTYDVIGARDFVYHLQLRSQAPLEHLAILTGEAEVLAKAEPRPLRSSSQIEYALHVAATDLYRDQEQQLYAFARDRWGNEVVQPIRLRGALARAPCELGALEMHRLPDGDSPAGRSSVVTIELEMRPLFVDWLDRHGQLHPISQGDWTGQGGEIVLHPTVLEALTRAHEVGQPRTVRLAVTGVLPCSAALPPLLWTERVEVELDVEPPALRVYPYAHQGGSIEVHASDPGGLSWVEVSSSCDGTRRVKGPTARVPVGGERITVRARDLAGNVSTRAHELVQQPEHRLRGLCDEVSP